MPKQGHMVQVCDPGDCGCRAFIGKGEGWAKRLTQMHKPLSPFPLPSHDPDVDFSRLVTVSSALSHLWDLGSISRSLRGISLVRKVSNLCCSLHMHMLANGWGVTTLIVQLHYQTFCVCVSYYCQLPFPSPIPLGKEGTAVAEISPQHSTGYGWGILRRAPGTEKTDTKAAGAAIVSFVFWPWDNCLQPSVHKSVGSSQICLSSGHVAPGKLCFWCLSSL